MAKKKSSQPLPPVDEDMIVEEELTSDILDAAKAYIKNVGDGKVGPEVYFMVKSRYKLIYVRTPEELRVIRLFIDMSKHDGTTVWTWDTSRGLINANTQQRKTDVDEMVHDNPLGVMEHIVSIAEEDQQRIRQKNQNTDGNIFLLLDFHPYLGENGEYNRVHRIFKQFVQTRSYCTVVVVAPVFNCPPSLEKEFTLIDFPFPSKYELRQLLEQNACKVIDRYKDVVKEAKANESDLIDAVRGLTINEADNAFSKSLVSRKRFDIPTIIEEKRQMIRKSGVLEYRQPKYDISQVGGLDTLIDWLMVRRLAFRDDARNFGLPMPKGVLLVGVPGSGKSLMCDALASIYKMPLLRLDLGAVFNRYVGESESNLRRSLLMAGACSPCILWVDEVEKGIAGTGGDNSGVSDRIFGTLLTWLQDKSDPVFVVATANNIHGIPPEFMRAGRFDEIFFLDLPDEHQRRDVINKIVLKKGRDPQVLDIEAIVKASKDYTPAEIEKGIDNALFLAFQDGKRGIQTADIVSQLRSFAPLYNSRREEIDAIREWAVGREGKGGRAVKVTSRLTVVESIPAPYDAKQAALDMDTIL